jgi:hypothetical protein
MRMDEMAHAGNSLAGLMTRKKMRGRDILTAVAFLSLGDTTFKTGASIAGQADQGLRCTGLK